MLKRVLSYLSILSALVLSSCSDEIDFQPAEVFSSDGMVEFNIAVPDMPVARSRDIDVDPEYKVNDITLLLYRAGSGYENTAPVQSERIYLNPTPTTPNAGKNKLEQVTATTLRLSFNLDKDLRSGGFTLYAFANLPATLNLSTKTVQGLKVETLTAAALGTPGNLVMMATASSDDIAGNLSTTITLNRVDAKMTVSNVEPTDGATVSYFPAMLCGGAERGYIMAPVLPDNNYAPSVAPTSWKESLGDADKAAVYFPQTKNAAANSNDFGGNLYVIVKAAYGIDEYYYRLDFCEIIEDSDGTKKNKYLDTEANHWYQFVIEEVTGPGYATPALAALHPENTVKYTIHDHCPESLNMTSDGFRELGVSHDIDYTGSPNGADEWNEQIALYVKLFSKDESEYPATANAVGDLITVENSWLVTGTPEEVDDDAVTGGTATGSDSNNPGRVYRIPLRFVNTTLPGTLENTITIEWLGLKRVVNVTWERQFNGAEVTSASLSMANPGSATVNIADYWSFLSSTDDPEGVTGNGNLWGIQPTANNGKIRNEGFHFPVMYGTSTTGYAKYTYTLTFDKGKFADSSLDYTPSFTVTGDIKNYVTVTKTQDKPARFTITYNTDNYNYLTGELNVIITYNTTPVTREVYSYDLYHTGFFHRDSQEYRVDEQDSGNYYYYEVVPVTVDGRTRYILDRNLGAKSAQDYIRDADGATITGSPDAAGGYYKIAYQPGNYKDPQLYAGVCPPGYAVPEKGEWDALRLSSSFHTEYDGRYYPAYYDTSVGRVYFPKSMMMIGASEMGESRTGYYWTSTAASGTEKDEIGRWLNMFVLTGGSTSFANGQVATYGLSVRCINESTQTFDVNRTVFNVSGATHVYLYTVDAFNQPTPTTTWPGHAIGNYITMASGNWFQFNYESTQFSPDKLKVIFNFVDEQGIIHSFSKGADGTTQYTDNKSPRDLIGWDVEGDTDPNIVPDDNMTINNGTSNQVDLVPANETALHQWWYCKSTTPYVSDYKKGYIAPEIKKYTIYWPKTIAGKQVFIRSADKNSLSIVDWSSGNQQGTYNGCYYYEFETAVTDNIDIMFHNGEADKSAYLYDKPLSTFTLVGDRYCAFCDGTELYPGIPVEHSYRIYWLNNQINSDEVYVWIKDGNSINYWNDDATCKPSGNENGYYYFNFKSTARDSQEFGVIFRNQNQNKTKYQNGGKEEFFIPVADFSEEDGVRCAYFDGSAWHAEPIEFIERSYRLYWPLIWTKKDKMMVGDNVINTPSNDYTIPTDIDSPTWGWYYVDFTSDDPTLPLIVYNSNTNQAITIGTLSQIFGSSTTQRNDAYLDYNFGEYKQGTPKNPIAENKTNVALGSGNRRVYWIKPQSMTETAIAYSYYWDGANSNSWPGNKMSQVISNHDWLWYIDIPDQANKIIFSAYYLDNENIETFKIQTGDLSVDRTAQYKLYTD